MINTTTLTLIAPPRLLGGWGYSLEPRTASVLSDKTKRLEHNREKIAALYETHFERVARYIAVRIGNTDEAQDLASEVFVKALRSADSYQETGAPLAAWIFKISHNLVVDHLRKKGRRPASVPLDEAFSLAGNSDPSEEVQRQQEVTQLKAALERLSEAQRRLLALRFGGEMTSEQIAQMLGKKPGAVREMQSAAIKKLRQILGHET